MHFIWVLVRLRESNPRPPALQSNTLQTELILPWLSPLITFFLITLFLCVSSWLRTKLLFTFLKKPVCSSRVSEVHTSVKSDGEPCGRLLYNDLRAITSSMEKAFNSRLDMKSGPRQYISAPRWNLCLKLTSNAIGMIHQSAKDVGSFVTNSKDITMFVAVSVSGLS